MRKMQQNRRHHSWIAQAGLATASTVVAVAAAGLLATQASAQTFLSVDINGGNPQPGGPTAGGPSHTPINGITWVPWAGDPSTGGDGTTLPAGGNNAIIPPIVSINHSFATPGIGSGTVTVTLQAQNIAPSTLNSLNSRDRGAIANNGGNLDLADMYRDFVFVSRDFARQNGANPMIINLSGLSPNTTYNFTGYSYDAFANGQELF